MADAREIVVKLVVAGEESEEISLTRDKTTDEKSGARILNNILHPIKTAQNALNKKAPVLGLIANYAVQSTKNQVLYMINRNFSLREDYQSEVTVSNALNIIGKATSLASAIGGGAMAGSMATPVGAIAGAIVGAIGWTVNEAISGYQKYDRLQISLNEMNQQSTFQRTRLGLIDGGRGTEN